MRDVERIVTMRVDEAASAPALKPSSTARRAANRNTAIATLITVSSVRRLLRFALLRTRPMNFIDALLPDLLRLDEGAFFEVQDARGALRRVRVVRDHHDRLLVFPVEPLQQCEHFARGLRVEVAGGLIGEQQGRVRDDRARDGDALFLSTRELTRVMLLAIAQPDDPERGHHVIA